MKLITGLLYMLTSLLLRKQTRKLASRNTDMALNRTEAVRASREKFAKTILLAAFIAVIGTVSF